MVSCSSTNFLKLTVNEPSPVYLPKDVQKIGIINRSLPSEKTAKLDDVDKLLSLEGKDLDKDGAISMMQGVYDELLIMDKFVEIKIIDNANVKSPGLGIFPAKLSWKQLDELCEENNVDVIYELSFYDTETVVKYNSKDEGSVGIAGVNVPVIRHYATIYTKIKSGWRIYDPLNKLIVDEFISHQDVVSKGSGINPLKAAEAVVGRKEATMDVSNSLGHNYALRILPYSTRVTRLYYVRGTNNFKIAKRRAQTGDWDGAAELWKKEVDNSKRKVAGRACFNMAIINEINGELDTAIDWASKSYVDYKNKKALDYLNALKYRKERIKMLKDEQ